MKREETLEKAKEMAEAYEADVGNPADVCNVIADYWTAYIRGKCCSRDADVFILPEDVANMMVLMKLGRITTGKGTLKSYIEIASYAACAGQLASEEDYAVE